MAVHDRDARNHEHHHDQRRPHDERVRRRADEFHDEQADEHDGAAAERDERHVSIDIPGQRLHRAAEPEDERSERCVPGDGHPAIIIAGLREAVAKLEEGVLAALARDEDVDACALQFLLRRYQTAGGAELGDIVGRALAGALTADAGAGSVCESASRLVLFVEATALSDDERLVPAMDALLARLRGAWAAPALEESTAAIGACLHAAGVSTFQSIAADAIDALEHAVGRVYRPGDGVGGGADQVRAASALLTAYSVCGRLPYSMLAEELIQSTRRGAVTDFAASCEAARVLCRLAALHDDPDYRAAAVLAPGANYRRDAEGLLARQTAEALRRGAAGAIYGVAVLELESPDSEV